MRRAVAGGAVGPATASAHGRPAQRSSAAGCFSAATGEPFVVKSTAKAPLRESNPLDLALHAVFEDSDAVHLVVDLFSLISSRVSLLEPEAASLLAQLADGEEEAAVGGSCPRRRRRGGGRRRTPRRRTRCRHALSRAGGGAGGRSRGWTGRGTGGGDRRPWGARRRGGAWLASARRPATAAVVRLGGPSPRPWRVSPAAMAAAVGVEAAAADRGRRVATWAKDAARLI